MTTTSLRLRTPTVLAAMFAVALPSCGGASEEPAAFEQYEQTEPLPAAVSRDTTPVSEQTAPLPAAMSRDTTPLPEPLRAFCSWPDQMQLAGRGVEGIPVKFERPRGLRRAPPNEVRCVVRSWEQWERLRAWGDIAGFNSVTPETFTHSMLILASMGEAPDNGYSIWIESVHSVDGTLRVTIRSGREAGGLVLPAITYPSDLIQLEKSDAEVRFMER